MIRPARFNEEALIEFREAINWYTKRSPEHASQFAALIDSSIHTICERPESWPVLPSRPRFRRRVLSKFPYSIVYRIHETEIVIAAISHQRRSPKHWLSRTR